MTAAVQLLLIVGAAGLLATGLFAALEWLVGLWERWTEPLEGGPVELTVNPNVVWDESQVDIDKWMAWCDENMSPRDAELMRRAATP